MFAERTKPSPSEGHASTFAPASLRGFATGMLAGSSLMARLASECWLRFSPSLDVFATHLAGSSPSECGHVCHCKILELFAGLSLDARLASPSPQPSPSEQADECLFYLIPLPNFLCLHFLLFHAYFLHNNTQIKGTKIVYHCIAIHLKQRWFRTL